MTEKIEYFARYDIDDEKLTVTFGAYDHAKEYCGLISKTIVDLKDKAMREGLAKMGYALVPIEPTKQILIAIASSSGEDLEEMEEKYRAAIAVAREQAL